ncbi:MAG: hypothetical protein GY865_07345 [candidate division Zixibacteria bacterium]|nr:hypothetical protein [candidate division Zixibacteria bacterium]
MMLSSKKKSIAYFNRGIIPWLAVALCTVFLVLVLCNSFLCDDAFITFRYASNLADGHGPVFNIGERVEGYTNFLWMIIMTIVIYFGGAPELWSRIISLVFSLGTIILFVKHTAIYGARSSTLILFPGFLIFSAPFFIWSSGGLETAAFCFFAFTGILKLLCDSKQPSGKSFLLSSLYLLAASLTRPEGIILFVLALMYIVILLAQKKIRAKTVLLYFLTYFISYGLYLWWRLSYYGFPLPNSYYVKSPGLELLNFGLKYYFLFIVGTFLWIPLLIIIHNLKMKKKNNPDGYSIFLFSVIVSYSLYVIYTGGDFMGQSRFLMPLLPIIYLFFQRLSGSVKLTDLSNKFKGIIGFLFIIFVIGNIYIADNSRKISHSGHIDSIGAVIDYTNKWTRVADLIKYYSLPTDTIAITSAGIIPYYSNLYTIDILGLIAPDLSKYRPRRGVRRPGHSVSISPEYFLILKPHFLIGHPTIVPRNKIKVNSATLEDIEMTIERDYLPVAVKLPGSGDEIFTFWLRRDTRIRMPKGIMTIELKD